MTTPNPTHGPTEPTSAPLPDIGSGPIVKLFAALTLIAGLITWFSAYHGVDDRWQINLGILITAFAITWWILGIILTTVERK